MKKHSSYKPTKIEFLDAIPEQWEEKRIRFLGYLYGGLTGKSANDFNQSDNDENKYFIPFTNIAGNLKINPDQLQLVVIKEDEKQNDVRVGDLFFLMSSEDYDDVGRSAVLTKEIPETYLNSFCKGLRLTTSEIHPEYLNYHLHSKQLRHNLLTEANGFTRINLKVGKVQDLYVAFPNKPEQTAIASYLDRKTAEIDELIADKKRLLELYEEEKTAIINQAVAKGINPNVPMKDSGIEWLGEIPEHWEVKRLKYLANLRSGNNIVSEQIKDELEYPVFGGNGIRGFFDDFTHEGNFILIGRQGAYCGNIQYAEGKFWASEHAVVLTPRTNYEYKYLGELLRTMNLGQYSVSAAQPGIAVEVIKNLQTPYPPIEEQLAIANHIETECSRINTQVERTKKLIDLLKEYREALISEVVTGQIKVIP